MTDYEKEYSNEHLYLGADHAGFPLKEVIKDHLDEKGINYTDLGTFSEDSVDYPDIAREVAEKVYENKCMGILFCGSGVGMSMMANRRHGVRAALVTNETTAELSRRHNNANILSLGARLTEEDEAKKIVDTFLSTKFEGGRHARRVGKIEQYSEEDHAQS